MTAGRNAGGWNVSWRFRGVASARRARGRSAGFTLVELLIVILIIGMLIALTFPAVQAARESGRQVTCLHRMNEMAKGIASYHEAKQRYPGWREVIDAYAANGTQPRVYYAAPWAATLTPQVGRSDVWEIIQAPIYTPPNTITYSTAMPSLAEHLVCPSDVAKTLGTNPTISFVANCGRLDVVGNNGPRDWRANAVFLDMLGLPVPPDRTTPWPNDPDQKVDNAFIQKNDGLSQTLMLSENLEATLWTAMSNEADNGFLFWSPNNDGSAPDPYVMINGTTTNNAVAMPFARARPSSNHRLGVNAMFCGGNGKFIATTINYRVYCALMTPAGRYASEPNSTAASNAVITNPPNLTGLY